MNPVKKDHYKCGHCGNDEVVNAGKTPKIMTIIVVGNEHQWCPDCVYTITSWRIHVNELHLRGPTREKKIAHDKEELKDLINGVEIRLSKHSLPMEHLDVKKGEITKFERVVG